jgi:thaumarchaeosortase
MRLYLHSDNLKKYWFHIFLLASIFSAIALLMFLDYFNMESIQLFNQQGFFFEYTWVGRMFLFIFAMLLVIESMLDWDKLEPNAKRKHRSPLKMTFISIFALLPLIYIVSVNFFGLDQTILSAGELLRGTYWKTQTPNFHVFLEVHWPLALEYIIFFISFLGSVLLAYGKSALKTFSISLGLIGGVSFFYLIDTWFPYGAFWPFQILTRPTAAMAAAVLQSLGFQFSLAIPADLDASPIFTLQTGLPLSVSVEWVCAGVHSLLLYSLIILLFFKKNTIATSHKIGYFVVGLIGTFMVNVLRVVTYVAVLADQGVVVAGVFHDTYGELFFAGWMLLYIALVSLNQKFQLPAKAVARLHQFIDQWRSKSVETGSIKNQAYRKH